MYCGVVCIIGSNLLVLEYIAVFAILARRLALVRQITSNPMDGDEGESEDWGYGQTTAVLLWSPLLRTAFKAAWGEWAGLRYLI